MCPFDSVTLSGKLCRLSEGISSYLVDYLSCRRDFGMRTFYGEAFALALLGRSGRLRGHVERKLIRVVRQKNWNIPEYHWEFNHYGLMEAGRRLLPLRFGKNRSTNWTLLRCNVRIRCGASAEETTAEALRRVRRMQKPSGLILDDPGVRSFQYHCFSAAMLYEIQRLTGDSSCFEAFLRAVAFIRRFILPDGNTLYVGRGQQQSFGYASLAYILSALYGLTRDASVLADLSRVVDYVATHSRPDGSLPLVLGGGPEPLPHPDAPHRSTLYPGWYAYNNFFDYLPFAGLFFKKAADLLSSVPAGRPVFTGDEPYRDFDFIKVVKGRTIAVVSRPGGYWTNDLPVPYVYSSGRVRSACYGGEQFEASLYSMRGVPLPVATAGTSMRWKARSFFIGDSLALVSPLGFLVRRYHWEEGGIEMRHRVLSPFRLRDRYLFPPEDGPVVHSEHPLRPAGIEYSAGGRLNAFEAERIGHIALEFPLGG